MGRIALRTAEAVVVLAATIGVAAALRASEKQSVKSDEMTGYQEVPGVSSNGTGSFAAEIDDDARTIDFTLTYTGLSSPAGASHIHFGNRFDLGGVSVFLCGGGGRPACPPGTSDVATVTGTIIPSDVLGPATQGIAPGEFDELVRAIRAGMTYANVHSALFGGGEIRAQVNNPNQRQQ